MKNPVRLLLFAALLTAVAVGTFYFCHVLRSSVAGPADSHYWIHSQLNITAEQHKRLGPLEEKFSRRRDELANSIRQAERELASAILADKSDSERVKAAVQKIHLAQGDLQETVLEHVFEMRPILTPEQYTRLIELTAQALRDDPAPK